jgi:hypothetical protein
MGQQRESAWFAALGAIAIALVELADEINIDVQLADAKTNPSVAAV